MKKSHHSRLDLPVVCHIKPSISFASQYIIKNSWLLLLKFFYCGAFLIFFKNSSDAQVTISVGNCMPTGSAIYGVSFGNGVYVAVGVHGYLITSPDAVHWTIRQTLVSFLEVTYSRVTFGNGIFVAITQTGIIVTSADGTTWTQRVSGTSNFLNDIIYVNTKFVVVGNTATILTSPDGITWTQVTTPSVTTESFQSVVYAYGKYIIGSNDNGGATVYYSATAASGSWTRVAATVSPNSLNKLLLLGTKLFITTSSTTIFTSPDAISWTAKTDANLVTPNQMFHGFYDGTTYYLFGNSSAAGYGYGSVFTSPDGNTFALQAKTTSIVAQGAYFVNGMYFQVGNEGLVTSTNGSNWSFPGGSFSGVATNGTTHVAVGTLNSNDAAIFTSTDWINWTNRSASALATKTLNGVTYGNGKYVAVGNLDAATFGTIATSTDGNTWTIGNSGIADALRAVAYGNSKYVAVGLNGRIIYSTNGTTWTSAESVSG